MLKTIIPNPCETCEYYQTEDCVPCNSFFQYKGAEAQSGADWKILDSVVEALKLAKSSIDSVLHEYTREVIDKVLKRLEETNNDTHR
jgi:hypothetical protein